MAVQDDEGRAALRALEHLEGVLDPLKVVRVADPLHIPAVPEEAGRHVFGKRDVRVPLDGDVVVVEDPAEVVEAEMSRERSRLRGDSFHEAAVTAHRIDVVVEDLETRFVVAVRQPLLGDGHAHARRDALPERTGGAFDARHPVVLGVTGRAAVELAEMADVVEGYRRRSQPLVFGVHRFGAGEMEHGPEQHRGMTVREDEPVAVRPDRILGIETHHAVPERVDQRRKGHRRSGMSRLGLLDGINRERADRIDRQLIQSFGGHDIHFGPPDAVRAAASASTLPRRRRCRSSLLYAAER